MIEGSEARRRHMAQGFVGIDHETSECLQGRRRERMMSKRRKQNVLRWI